MQVSLLSTKEIHTTLLAAAAEQGMDITVAQFIHIQPVAADYSITDNSVVVFTSANAVNNVRLINPTWQIFCTGGATLEALLIRLPDAHIAATASNATALATHIIEQGNISTVVFFCGNIRRNELPDLLQQHHITVQEIVVYETIEAPAVTTNIYDGILFFSPSGVRSYFSLNTLPAHTVCFAIGNTTAHTLKEYTTNKIITNPDVPSSAQMVQTAISYFNNIN
jgi:uroporphyrinogen-III synthase